MNGNATLEARYRAVLERIGRAAAAAGRDAATVRLLAVGKTFPAEDVRALAALGLREFGENYVQEAEGKIAALADLGLVWHFIGPIQSNKTRRIAEAFDWVQSLEDERIARRLSAQRPPDRSPLNVCLQVNLSGEATKSGVAPEEAIALARHVAGLPNLRMRGIMGIPAPAADPAQLRREFRALRACYDACDDAGLRVDTLSMGMSADLELAIAEGSTEVRIGTAIFGERQARR